MTPADYVVFALYMLGVMGVGFYFLRGNQDAEDYYVGGRSVGATHVGLSIAATDVGGGFSIMVSGLFIPTLGAFFWPRAAPAGALWGMLAGGTVTVLLQLEVLDLPASLTLGGLDPTAHGIALSALVFVFVSLLTRNGGNQCPTK